MPACRGLPSLDDWAACCLIGPLAATSPGLPDVDLALSRAESREYSSCSPKQIFAPGAHLCFYSNSGCNTKGPGLLRPAVHYYVRVCFPDKLVSKVKDGGDETVSISNYRFVCMPDVGEMLRPLFHRGRSKAEQVRVCVCCRRNAQASRGAGSPSICISTKGTVTVLCAPPVAAQDSIGCIFYL
jgi:hypothetical protein